MLHDINSAKAMGLVPFETPFMGKIECTCDKCAESHPCPYAEDIDGDEDEAYCNCCEYCTKQCERDI